MYRTITTLSAAVLNVLFPEQCISCGTGGSWLCQRCAGSIDITADLRCVRCRKRSPDGAICASCPKHDLTGLWSACRYANPVLLRALHTVKYQYARVLIPRLSSVLLRYRDRYPFLFHLPALYIPVPLHRSKEAERGFNQSHELLAYFLAAGISGACGCWLLARTKRTFTQAHIPSPELRTLNMKNAFAYIGPKPLPLFKGEREGVTAPPFGRVVVFDDVGTSGGTLSACARTLRNAGATDVWGFVLAKS